MGIGDFSNTDMVTTSIIYSTHTLPIVAPTYKGQKRKNELLSIKRKFIRDYNFTLYDEKLDKPGMNFGPCTFQCSYQLSYEVYSNN
jgi:hypothetical protein